MTKASKAKAETKRRQPQPEDFPILFERVSEGASMAAACRERGIDAPSVSKAIYADPKLEADYNAARAERGDHYGERVNEIGEGILAGTIEPAAGRAAADCFKWTSARMSPKRWGDKIAHEHTGQDGGPIQTKTTLDVGSLTVEQRRALASIPVHGD